MDNLEIAHRRLYNQRLAGNSFERPEEAVGWLGAVQAQDYGGAKWALGQRTAGVTNADLDRLFNEGAILRTHMLRPTWHFVLPEDIGWMLKLTSPRVHAVNAYYYRKLELDEEVFRRSEGVIRRALEGGKQLTRTELAQGLDEAGIEASGQRLAYVIMRAELDGVICSGGLRGKQFTYGLLAERVGQRKVRTLEGEESLAELTRRYFKSHGPATAQDFMWWSGLSGAEVKAGLELVKGELEQRVREGKTYWLAAPAGKVEINRPVVHLLPNYDEHLVAYKDHSASFDPAVFKTLDPTSEVLLAHVVVLDGQVVGGWKRTLHKDEVRVSVKLLMSLDEAEQGALEAALEGYGRFMGLKASLYIRQNS